MGKKKVLRLSLPLSRVFIAQFQSAAVVPQIEAAPERLGVEQDLLSWYVFFFSQGTPKIVWAAANAVYSQRRLIPFVEESSSVRELGSLGTLVALLVKRHLFPRKVMAYANAYENSYLTAE